VGLRQKLSAAAETARGRKARLGLINAAKEMMKGGDFSRPTIAGLVHDKCDKALSELIGASAP
jgi:hypothetical protein